MLVLFRSRPGDDRGDVRGDDLSDPEGRLPELLVRVPPPDLLLRVRVDACFVLLLLRLPLLRCLPLDDALGDDLGLGGGGGAPPFVLLVFFPLLLSLLLL